ncbi:hypothetical protein AXF42_Ash020776 [Apostasia shenzhenica]|uniref:Uncharacterized protein n=1 Tax=Apostasia shenzhenica TaxID=1088818 RepID=A0A2I0A4H2_9ASPA|nr:hypothetical protein AXF42_Ash020776 [Apostasia shenzhenica]
MVTGLTAQQVVILRQTHPVCAVLPPPPVAVAPELLPSVAAIPVPLPPATGVPAPAPPVAAPSIQSSSSSRPPRHPFRLQEARQNSLPPCPLPQPAFLPPAFPPFLAG